MIRFRLYFDKDAETKWLNEMAEQGWAMKHFFAGFSMGYVFSFLILAFLLAFFNVINKTSNIIARLQERKGMTAVAKKKSVSTFLLGGLLLNSCALMMNGNVNPMLHHLVQIAAIVFMVIGIYRTVRNRER